MAKTEIQKEEKISNITTIDAQRKALSDQINSLLSEITEISSGIQQAEQTKTQAKENYNKCLDAGNESGMSKALSLIREANGNKERLTNSLSGFSEKIEALRTAYSELMSIAQSVRTAAEEKLETVRAEFENVKLLYDRCNLLGSINNLNNALQKICDQVAPEPLAKMPKSMSDYPGNV